MVKPSVEAVRLLTHSACAKLPGGMGWCVRAYLVCIAVVGGRDVVCCGVWDCGSVRVDCERAW